MALGLLAAFVVNDEIHSNRNYKLAQERANEEELMTMIAKWNDADGIEHIVETPRPKDENGDPVDRATWVAEHAANVAALKAAFPPV